MALEGLDHFTIRVLPEQLGAVRRFYVEVLGLAEGERPGFSFPGHWLYLGGRPVVHLAGRAAERLPRSAETGGIDHIAFRARGLERMRAHLEELGVAFEEKPAPGQGLYQLFVTDPAGIQVELNYPGEEAKRRDYDRTAMLPGPLARDRSTPSRR